MTMSASALIKALAHKTAISVSASFPNATFSLKASARAALVIICTVLPASVRANDSLYQDLGGKEGITKIVDVEMVRHLANPRIKAEFDDTNIARLKGQLVIFICEVSGGPCKYTGPDLRTVHKGMHLTEADFNALIEDMQLAMDEAGIPYRTQNRLLARLAPYERDVVTK